jgi:aryl-alcohol dehydrogenase-like predicted oxidoreductase
MDKIVLGTVQLGLSYGVNNSTGKPQQEIAFNILETAFQNGIDTLDTAEAYGSSQEVIGTFHKQFNHRFKVISKLHPSTAHAAEVIGKLEKMIDVLGVDSLEVGMLHHFKTYTEQPEVFNELCLAKEKGLIKKTGVSLYTNNEIETACLDERIDVVQMPFNLLDNMKQRGVSLKKLKDAGKEVHTRSVFLQGLFFKANFSSNEKVSALQPYIISINNLCEEYGVSKNNLALNYALRNNQIDKVLIGVEQPNQLTENLLSAKASIPNELFEKISQLGVAETTLLNPANWQ